ncbi:MAG: histidinol-phosphatase, partial [Gammaproteobacteria bacterium]
MEKSDIVRILEEIAVFLEFAETNPFEVNAFRNGAQYLDEWQGDLQQAVREGTLTDIYGIGKGIASVVTELVRTGRSEKYDKLRGAYPAGFLELFHVPGLGMKKIKALHAA